jgi:hypothetical protein
MNQHTQTVRNGRQYLIFTIFLGGILGIVGLITFMSHADIVRAASFTVNISADATDFNPGDGACEIANPPQGICTLRAAIEETNALPGTDEIIIPNGVYTLTIVGSDDTAFAGDLDILDNLIINGGGVTTTLVDGGGIDTLFNITGTISVTISNITIYNGQAADGGGITNNGGTLTIDNVIIRNNRANNNGGGISNQSGSVSLSNSIILNNEASIGGGIHNLSSSGVVSMTNSSLISNTALASGGSIFNGGIVTIMNSTVSTNTAVSSGGGIIQLGGYLTITNSTFSGNSAANGAGIYNNNGIALITNSTINNNSAPFGAGIAHFSGTLALKNTIISNNLLGGDCTGAVTSNGNNLDSDGSCNLTAPSDISSTNPLLDPLQNNGGNTLTHALQWGSPAIEAGDNTTCSPADQRGVPRSGICDIGAYEFEIQLLYLPIVLKTDPPIENNCNRLVPLFTTDTAPTNGTLEFRVLFGEQDRIEGITLKVWNVVAGQQINNEEVAVEAPKWVRVWWQPDGDPQWYLLPSQYWVGDGTVASEYGISCGTDPAPSYHTSFADAIPESQVPILTLP